MRPNIREQFRMTRWALAFSILAANIAAAPAGAATDALGFEDLSKLETRLTTALDAGIGVPGGPLTHIDRRVKLQPCPSPVTIDPPALGAVALRCEALGWRIRVPLIRLAGQASAGNAAGADGRALYAQSAYTPSAPMAPPLIKRGDPVELAASQGGFTVTTQAVAQEDGRAGGRIRVKTDPRAPIIIGEVVDMGRVRVTSF
jgi:flagella basal body P-ring formation protein FlgA